jgi:hypothetical protein
LQTFAAKANSLEADKGCAGSKPDVAGEATHPRLIKPLESSSRTVFFAKFVPKNLLAYQLRYAGEDGNKWLQK